MPSPPTIRKGRNGAFHDKGLEGASHHAIVPNVNRIGDLKEVWPRLTQDEKKLFDEVARSYLASAMPDYRYRQTSVSLYARGYEFRATGRQPLETGWRDAFPGWRPDEEKGKAAQRLPVLRDRDAARLSELEIEDKETRPPPRYREGTLIEAMQNAWRFVEDEALRYGASVLRFASVVERADSIRDRMAHRYSLPSPRLGLAYPKAVRYAPMSTKE